MKRLVLVLIAACLALAGVAVARAWRLESRQVDPVEPADITIDPAQAAERLAGAVRFPTISWGDAARRDSAAFLGLHDYLAGHFPNVSRAMTREVVAGYSLLYTWPGTQPALPPLILAAHLDVVPAPTGEGQTAWTHPPFDGVIADGRVWGRGTIDDKCGALGLLEAAEALIAAGFTPDRTTYLAFGHNEEGGGDANGALAIAQLLGTRGVRNATVFDEGGLITIGVPGLTRAVAFVGIGEKGYAAIDVTVASAGGHASMPPRETAVGILARALDRIERNPMPQHFDGALRDTFLTLAPEMSPALRIAFANAWLTRPLLLRQLAATPQSDALTRTTIAPTELEGSSKANVLATRARAGLNVRLLPGDSADDVIAHLTRAVDDPRVQFAVGPQGWVAASRVSDAASPEFRRLSGAIRAVHRQTVVAPILSVAASDARQYENVSTSAFRFLPVDQPGALELFHGPDEHIVIDVYERAIRTYATIIRELGDGGVFRGKRPEGARGR